MTITLYSVGEKTNKVVKTLGTGTAYTGNLRDNCSLLDPVVDIAAASMLRNYAYITEFARYYFIKKITVLRTGLFRLEMHVDVLQTYQTQIRALRAIIKRQQNVYNMYLDDPLFQAQNKRQIVTKRIGSSAFSPSTNTGVPCFVLTVAGGGEIV